LTRRHLIRSASGSEQEIADYQAKHAFLLTGPTLHIMIVSLRCNHECNYCHASRKPMNKRLYDMTPEIAAKAIELIFQTTAEEITIEFQGGEPLANFPVVRFIIEQARQRNVTAGKNLSFSLVTNLSLMDDEKLTYLYRQHVQICTSLDGSEEIHNAARKFREGNSYQKTIKWIKRVNEEFLRYGLDPSAYQIQALLTVTRPMLSKWKEVIDAYVDLGMKTIFLRPLNPFGFAKKIDHQIGYPPEAFLAFYFHALDYIIEKNKEGKDLIERFAAIFLTKILTPFDPNYLDIRSPCGAGIGQVAYNYDGKIFTCDEGRMVYQMGDNAFQIGDVRSSEYTQIMTHETVKDMYKASWLDGLPGCADCAYKPFCGTCPVYNYTEHGTLLLNHRTNDKCKIHMAIMDRLFTLLNGKDQETVRILTRWTQPTERRLFYQGI
jgi:His-Xaa-Ser system radical SAM maturase HxsB